MFRNASVLLVTAIGLIFLADCVAKRDSPNVLLITIDTLRADHLSCYGYPLPSSPRIDQLARDGILFEDTHCQVPKTNPSLTSLFTGLYPENHKNLTLRFTLSSAYVLLTERLRSAGYHTGAIVGQYNLIRQSGFDRGFEDYIDDFPGPSIGVRQPGRFYAGTEKRAAALTDRALGWVKGLPSGRPFFLWIHYVDPHAAYDPPPPFDHSFSEGSYPTTTLTRDQIHDQAFDPPHFALSYYQQRYDGEIRYLDSQIGRLLDGLQDSHLRDNSIVILTADHGEYLGDTDGPGADSGGPVAPYFSHGITLSNGETHVPLLWNLPKAWASRRKSLRLGGPTEIVDVAPTLLDLLGLAPLPANGRSLAASLRGGAPTSPEGRAYSYSAESNSVSLQTSRWKLIYYPGQLLSAFFEGRGTFRSIAERGRIQLFDRKDGSRARDVAGAHPDAAEKLKAELLERLRLAPGPGDPKRYPVNLPWDDTEHLRRLRALGYL